MFKPFIVLEIVFAAGFVALTWLFTATMGVLGVVVAHAVNYAIYWIVVIVIIRQRLNRSA
jgi:polysaccharide transporter, PST family